VAKSDKSDWAADSPRHVASLQPKSDLSDFGLYKIELG